MRRLLQADPSPYSPCGSPRTQAARGLDVYGREFTNSDTSFTKDSSDGYGRSGYTFFDPSAEELESLEQGSHDYYGDADVDIVDGVDKAPASAYTSAGYAPTTAGGDGGQSGCHFEYASGEEGDSDEGDSDDDGQPAY